GRDRRIPRRRRSSSSVLLDSSIDGGKDKAGGRDALTAVRALVLLHPPRVHTTHDACIVARDGAVPASRPQADAVRHTRPIVPCVIWYVPCFNHLSRPSCVFGRWLFALGVLVLAAGAVFLYSRPEPVPVTLATVER